MPWAVVVDSTEMSARLHKLSLALALVMRPAAVAAQGRPCDDPTPLGPSRDLYCIELIPAPGITGASGRVELGQVPGPFTVAVTPDGRPRSQLSLFVAGLPSPAALGPYRTYIAWIATPTMDSVVRLGSVENGRTPLGVVGLEKFTFLITAEPAARVTQPSGKLILRGQSPATRLYPPDLLQFSIGSMSQPSGGRARAITVRWRWRSGVRLRSHAGTPFPCRPGLTMLPAEMALRPKTKALAAVGHGIRYAGPPPRAGASRRWRHAAARGRPGAPDRQSAGATPCSPLTASNRGR